MWGPVHPAKIKWRDRYRERERERERDRERVRERWEEEGNGVTTIFLVLDWAASIVILRRWIGLDRIR